MMKVLYLECKNSGIAGDMLLAALYGLNEDDSVLSKIQTYVNDNFKNAKLSQMSIDKVLRNGISPNHLVLKYIESRPELHVDEIQGHIPKLGAYLGLTPPAIQFASKWFDILLEAERSVHSISNSDHVHLHELGSIDTLIDICGGTAYFDTLGVFSEEFQIFCSVVAVGGGMVKISHGKVPVPAPATTKIIEKYNIPVKGGPIEKELLTPTGAAFLANLKHFDKVQFIENMPLMTIKKTGMSTGTLGNETFPNILRIFSGSNPFNKQESGYDVIVLETMVDDSSGETLGITMDHLFQEGALDVNFLSVQGKKNRPGVLVRVLSSINLVDKLMEILITNLGTLGVRYRTEKRICLKREIIELETTIDNVSVKYHVKVAFNPSKTEEILFFKVEHDDIVRISNEMKKPLSYIRAKLESAYFAK